MKLGQVAVTVENLSAAVEFHRDVLGLTLLFEVPNLAFFDMGGVRLMLSGAQGGEEEQPFVLYFPVDDLETAWKDALARGGRPGKEPHCIASMADHDLWMAFLRDPDDRMVGLMSEVRH